MTDFLNSVKADLLDRRVLPFVALVFVGLAAAVAYAFLGGSSAPQSASSGSSPSTSSAGLAVSQVATGATGAVAEVTSGTSAQRSGYSHNPFTPLPTPKAKVAIVTKPATASTPAPKPSSSGSGSGSGSGSEGSSTPKTTTGVNKPAKPAAPKTIYKVAVQFGPLPEGGTQNTQLQAYAGLSKPTPLPSAAAKLIEFIGVSVGKQGRSATFALGGEVILKGTATCVPSPTQCRLIEVLEGKSEQLEFFTPSGQPETYELFVVSIASEKATTAAVKSVLEAQRPLTERDGVLSLSGMRFGPQVGVIVLAGHHAFGTRAHSAGRKR